MILAALVAGIFLTNCKKDSTTPSSNSLAKLYTLNAPNSGSWRYFSFSKGDTVKITGNPLESAGWDLAFQQYYIKTNSGKSGKGIGGAFNTLKTGTIEFDSLKIVPDSASLVIDDSTTFYVAGGSTIDLSVNSILKNWYNYDNVTHILTSKKYVYIVKTADGKFVKLMIDNYLYDSSKGSFFDLKYYYQADGTKKLSSLK